MRAEQRMDKSEPTERRSAKDAERFTAVAGACWIAVHLGLTLLELDEDARRLIPRIILLILYALCLAAFDWGMWRLQSKELARDVLYYWIAAGSWMCLWSVYGERCLASSGDVMKLLLTLALVPYAPMPLWAYAGWPGPRQAHPGVTLLLLALCAAHIGFCFYVSRTERR